MNGHSDTNTKLVLIGGTGGLGNEMAPGLRTAQGFDGYVALVRDETTNWKKAEALGKQGWTIKSVDFDEMDELKEALMDARVVVSTLSGPELLKTEKRVIDACRAARVELFVPSQFGVDTTRWTGKFPIFETKKKILTHAENRLVPVLKVYTGIFSDVGFDFLTDIKSMSATIIGAGDANISFTKRSDIGLVLARALDDESYYDRGGELSMEGDNKTWAEALKIAESIYGREFKLERLTPQEALQKEKALLAKANNNGEDDMASFYRAFALHLLGEPMRKNPGCDLRRKAKSYGVKMETLEEAMEHALGGA
eukprot:CAMPEP_0194041832 /NCGR_PEP_ID=MMETSP0009_2-20130614/13653_1 /TAXON_ID=210454 /ORGANISM="Grammatophora oceanica, Strain CCMP 410" /LENGTH=310 /DNA_ID=CAMNT_0038685447 /DNA_START=245 /DNA_END=1177 /DNA_ORIENTATION=+